MAKKIKQLGGIYLFGQHGYEQARREACWNERIPDRFPKIIIQANHEDDVFLALEIAQKENLKICVRSGGHSWTGNHIQDNSLLLDLWRLDQANIDKNNMQATAEPGLGGFELVQLLAKEGLFFPAGHCKGVSIGGYLLQGGYGWHSRTLGPACMSVIGVDIITSQGKKIHANATENSDYYWLARGSGPNFFGVITKYYIKLYERPKIIGMKAQVFGIHHLEAVFRWAHAIGPDVPNSVEFQMLMSRHIPFIKGPGILAVAPIFADNKTQIKQDLSFMDQSPIRSKATIASPFLPTGLPLLYKGVMMHYPDHHRYAVDNLWTHADIDSLLPHIQSIANTLPCAPSHLLWLNWQPPATRGEASKQMIYSKEDNIYIALYGVWKKAQDDVQNAKWAERHIKAMEPLATGCQLADENVIANPKPFWSEENQNKFKVLKKEYDPKQLFYGMKGSQND